MGNAELNTKAAPNAKAEDSPTSNYLLIFLRILTFTALSPLLVIVIKQFLVYKKKEEFFRGIFPLLSKSIYTQDKKTYRDTMGSMVGLVYLVFFALPYSLEGVINGILCSLKEGKYDHERIANVALETAALTSLCASFCFIMHTSRHMAGFLSAVTLVVAALLFRLAIRRLSSRYDRHYLHIIFTVALAAFLYFFAALFQDPLAFFTIRGDRYGTVLNTLESPPDFSLQEYGPIISRALEVLREKLPSENITVILCDNEFEHASGFSIKTHGGSVVGFSPTYPLYLGSPYLDFDTRKWVYEDLDAQLGLFTSVLTHEIGHLRSNHTIKSMYLCMALSLAVAVTASSFVLLIRRKYGPLERFFCLVWLSSLLIAASLALSYLYRCKNEYDADAYLTAEGMGRGFISYLRQCRFHNVIPENKVEFANQCLGSGHQLFMTHPSDYLRIKKIEQRLDKMM